jgi:hypothetical protein
MPCDEHNRNPRGRLLTEKGGDSKSGRSHVEKWSVEKGRKGVLTPRGNSYFEEYGRLSWMARALVTSDMLFHNGLYLAGVVAILQYRRDMILYASSDLAWTPTKVHGFATPGIPGSWCVHIRDRRMGCC